PPTDGREKPAIETEIEEILGAVAAMNGSRVNDLLVRSLVTRGPDSFVMDLLPLLLERTGEQWREKSICPAHEHLLSASLQRLLGWTMGQLSAPENAPVLISVTPTGQRHEMGALMCAILAASHGWRVEYLGPDLPAADIARAAASTGARIVALSVVHRTSSDALVSEIRSLRGHISSNVTIMVGGREAHRHRDKITRTGAILLDSLEEFRDYLIGSATQA
ncbi:MAG TPA: cobalamin-dependent protein, partial [Gemmatimonadaceae bacterium]|nr:cobalamin-dependent protein [Gemmatimonadaceae bacterium]